jgi:ankyrin repeat protein
MAQASLSILLGVDGLAEDNSVEISPMAKYAAEYWARHAQFEDVASRVKGMEVLFDPDKPYFATWCRLHDIDPKPSYPSVFFQFTGPSELKYGETTPLYYAALCGFSNIVEKLIVEHPEQVGAIGGYYWTPAVAALAGRHFQIAQVLHRNGSSVNPPGGPENSTLHSAAAYGDLEMVQVLVLDYGIDVDVRNTVGATPLLVASSRVNTSGVVRWLLDHGADPDAQIRDGSSPLHQAIRYGMIELVGVLVEHGANVETKDEEGRTPLDYCVR